MIPTEYQIMNINPEQNLISKSFCDITSYNEQLKYLKQFNKHDIMTKGLHLYCNIKIQPQTMDDIKMQVIMNMASEENTATVALKSAEGDLSKAMKIIETTHVSQTDFADFAAFVAFQLPVFIKIANNENSDVLYAVHEDFVRISYDVWVTASVMDILDASIQRLNEKMREEYEIMKPDAKMISKSFCDISCEAEQLKQLNQFNRNDIMTKGLHLLCCQKKDMLHQSQTVDNID
eukprot:UN05884